MNDGDDQEREMPTGPAPMVATPHVDDAQLSPTGVHGVGRITECRPGPRPSGFPIDAALLPA
jgi:hypothetical protein